MKHVVMILLAGGLLAGCDTLQSAETSNVTGTAVGATGGALVGGVPGAVVGGAAGYGAAEAIDETAPKGQGGGWIE